MALDIENLEQARERGGKIIARCPACAELGEDRSADNLAIYADGSFTCIKHVGPHGKDHRRRIAELAGTAATETPATPLPLPHPVRRPARPLPALRAPTNEEMAQIARVRGWPTAAGLEVLVERGQLFTADVWDDGRTWPAWVVTDPSRANAQARRMDGAIWAGIDAKAKSLPGTTASRVVGASLIGARPQVWLMEGGPDMLAAPVVAKLAGLELDQIAFTAITGAGNPIAADDLVNFVGKTVTIAVHADGAGAEAAGRWARQLYDAGAVEVVGFDFTGSGGKDLADHLRDLGKPGPRSSSPVPRVAPERPEALAAPARACPLLVPLEAQWVEGGRYSLAGAHEVRTRLPLFVRDDRGDTLRARGALIFCPLT